MFKDILKSYKNSLSFFIPFEMMIEDGIILNKNNGFQATFKCRFYDLDYVETDNQYLYIQKLNEAYKKLPDGYTIHFDVQRSKNNDYPKVNLSDVPIPTKVIENIRENSIKNIDFYRTEIYITLTYIISGSLINKMDSLDKKFKGLRPGINGYNNEKEEILKEFNKELREFKDKCILFKNQIDEVSLELNLLKNGDLLAYLYSTINYEKRDYIEKPENLEIMLDEYLANSNIENINDITKINGEYIKVLRLNVFPNAIYPRIFSELEKLNFEYRYVTRFIVLSKEETDKMLKELKLYYSFKIKTVAQHFIEFVSRNNVSNTNKEAEDKEYEISEIKDEFDKGDLAYGLYTFSFIIKDKDLEKLEEKILEVKKIVELKNFTVSDDVYNVFDSYLGAIPGNIVNNIRRLPINTYLLSSLMPMSSTYQGEITNKHFKDKCLFTTKTDTDLFYGNIHNKDVGHSIVIGPTGTGKSTLLAFLVSEFLKYKHKKVTKNGVEKKKSRVIFFDKGGSSKILAELCGGKFYNLGNNELAFQPLKDIDDKDEKRFVIDWLCNIFEKENIEITPKIRNILDEAIESLANASIEDRTLFNFTSFVQDQNLRQALSFYCGNGIYSEYFDSNTDNIDNNDFIVFEMGEVVNEPKIIEPLLDYLFHKIEKEFLDGTPLLIVLDECWTFLKNPKMKDTIEKWLKELRKKNASVIFATQSLTDITKSDIAPTIIDNCPTNIFLPNTRAVSKWLNLYQEFDLNDIQIQTIANGTANRDYFIKNNYGSREFSLNLTNLELCYVGKSSVNDHNMILKMKNEVDTLPISRDEKIRELNNMWIEYNYNTNYISYKEYKMFSEIMKG